MLSVSSLLNRDPQCLCHHPSSNNSSHYHPYQQGSPSLSSLSPSSTSSLLTTAANELRLIPSLSSSPLPTAKQQERPAVLDICNLLSPPASPKSFSSSPTSPSSSSSSSSSLSSLEQKKKIKRRRATAKQVQVLNQVFEQTLFPSTQLRMQLGKELGMSPRTVQIWFQNRRQAIRMRERCSNL